MIDILFYDLSKLKSSEFTLLLNQLPVKCKQEVLYFQNEEDRQRKLLGKQLVSFYTGLNWKDIRCTEAGKPRSIHKRIEFNLSHSEDLVVAAFSQNEIGIDIEYIKDIDYSDIIKQFHPLEQEYIRIHPQALSAFYRIWTRKEAYLKARGSGISSGLEENCLPEHISKQGEWFLQDFLISKEYASSICQQSQIQSLNIREVRFDDLKQLSKPPNNT